MHGCMASCRAAQPPPPPPPGPPPPPPPQSRLLPISRAPHNVPPARAPPHPAAPPWTSTSRSTRSSAPRRRRLPAVAVDLPNRCAVPHILQNRDTSSPMISNISGVPVLNSGQRRPLQVVVRAAGRSVAEELLGRPRRCAGAFVFSWRAMSVPDPNAGCIRGCLRCPGLLKFGTLTSLYFRILLVPLF
eukprot:SAG31_NODE_5174_length_2700_cov_2.550942_4_plen_188_part_00